MNRAWNIFLRTISIGSYPARAELCSKVMAMASSYPSALVLSDAHFGEDGALLEEVKVLERLYDRLEKEGRIQQVILLGDIWDLWKTDLATAVDKSRMFFRMLSALEGLESITVLCGNHDHHIYFSSSEYRFTDEKDERGGLARFPSPLWEKESPNMRRTLEISPQVTLRFKYPFHLIRRGKETMMLTHGHQLDFFASRFWWAKTAWLARLALKRVKGVSALDIELRNAPFFETLYLLGRVPELSERAHSFYRLFRALAKFFMISVEGSQSPRRFSTVDDNSKEIEHMLGQLYPGYIPQIFIFGHTHRAGVGKIKLGSEKLEVYNCGSWLSQEKEPLQGNFILIKQEVELHAFP